LPEPSELKLYEIKYKKKQALESNIMKKIKIVSIGGFGHTSFVFDDIVGMSEAGLVGLSPAYDGEDITSFKSHSLATETKVYDDYISMLDSVKPDIAIISTRLDLIPKLIIEAANRGCNIITEKPLALDIGTLETVYKAVKTNNVNLMAMLSMRSDQQFVAAKEVYQSGVIGEAVIVNARKSYKWGKRPAWFGEKDKYGSTIGWVGIHALDFTNFVTGLNFTRIAAMQRNFAHREFPACQDNCGLLLELDNGGHATVSVDYFRPEDAETWGDDWLRIVGTKGILQASGSRMECEVHINGKGVYNHPLPAEKDKIFRKFILSLRNGTNQNELQQLSFALTEACLKADFASRSNTIVKINPEQWR